MLLAAAALPALLQTLAAYHNLLAEGMTGREMLQMLADSKTYPSYRISALEMRLIRDPMKGAPASPIFAGTCWECQLQVCLFSVNHHVQYRCNCTVVPTPLLILK
jgi:hypothetical protein